VRDDLPPKLFFRIGEVAGLVGVEPHVLRYWEREFRSIRPTKSAKGQRVYSRKDVENLLRVRDLLYRDGFTIAGAKKKLQHGDDPTSLTKAQVQHEPESMPHAKLGSARERERGHHHEHAGDHDLALPATQVATSLSSEQDDEESPESEHVVSVMQSAEAASAAIASASATATPPTPRVREKLVALRSEIESFLAELQPESGDALPRPRVGQHGKSES